jgi:hypothetical protein
VQTIQGLETYHAMLISVLWRPQYLGQLVNRLTTGLVLVMTVALVQVESVFAGSDLWPSISPAKLYFALMGAHRSGDRLSGRQIGASFAKVF